MNSPVVPPVANRAEAEAFLDERMGHGVQPGLERIAGLLEYMGDPHRTYPTIHIAGTNGKTTVTRMVQQILGAHGLATGGFTSPHLDRVEERFALHGAPIDADGFTEAVRDIAWFVTGYEEASGSPVTYFEVTAALAYSIFANAAVDVAVIEVGLGGRLDATNVVDADVSVITGVDIDHTEYLGSTIEMIAGEKAAILKSDGTVVSGALPDEARTVLAARVEETGSRWVSLDTDFSVLEAVVGVGGWLCTISGVYDTYDEVFLPLHGRHQVDHLATAIACSEMFLGRALDIDLLVAAAASVTSPGRLEVVGRRPIVILDGAHNRQGFLGLSATLDEEFPPIQWKLVLGLRGNREVSDLLTVLKGRVDRVYATAARDPVSHDAVELAAGAAAVLGVEGSAFANPLDAVEAARADAGPDGGVIVAGSLYLVGEVHGALAGPARRPSDVHVRYDSQVLVDGAGEEDVEEEEDTYDG